MSLHALFIHGALEERHRFRTVSDEVGVFGSLHIASTFGEGLERLRSDREWGALYLGGEHDAPMLANLVEAMRSTRQGRACSFMVHLGSQTAPDFFRAAVTSGVDGFLASKFSPDDLKASAQVAKKSYQRRSREVILNDLVAWGRYSATAIDEAYALAKDVEPHHAPFLRAMERKPCIEMLSVEARAHYLDKLAEMFADAKPAVAVAPTSERIVITPTTGSGPRVIRSNR